MKKIALAFFIVFGTLIFTSAFVRNSKNAPGDLFGNNKTSSQVNSACSNTFLVGDSIMYSHVDGTTTRLREKPNTNSNITKVAEGSEGTIIGNPVCDGTYTWWNISVNGYTGWTTEYTTKDGWLLERH